jgi:hypothetical protein
VPKPCPLSKTNTHLVPYYSQTSRTAQYKLLFIPWLRNCVCSAYPQHPFGICLRRNVLAVGLIRRLTIRPRIVRLSRIIPILLNSAIGTFRVGCCRRLIQGLRLVRISSLILMGLFVPNANYLNIGVSRLIFVKNVKMVLLLI